NKGRNGMEEQEEGKRELARAAKAHLVQLMQAGYPWREAVAAAGLHMSRSTAYRLVQAVQTHGEAALQDKRQGHPAKLREAVLQWLVATCRAHPQMPSSEVRVALQEQFDIAVSLGHLNRVRAQWGMGKRVGCQKKNGTGSLLHRKLNGKRVLVPCCLLPLRTRPD
ncbi:MAG: helix-turn-helix domain containing protein, partial [Ktedonobacteraceae bacterium]|nr:helix-turn-helix domain containing protein [Ktedonobacteraceae bacterium]